jgi:hypothetical protein
LSTAKVLLFDIETAPSLGHVWEKWETNVLAFERDWYMLCWAAKWLGDRKPFTRALPDYSSFKRDKENDRELISELWNLFDQADIIVAHNIQFDVRKTNARFAYHQLNPPSPYRTFCTLKAARKHFAFTSNKLDDLGQYLGLGRKIPHTGAHLWLGCMNGDPKAWGKMRAYNEQDVVLLDRVYNRLAPWATSHPNLTFYTGKTDDCPVCQSSHTKASGFAYVRTGKRQRRACLKCGHRYQCGGLVK